MRVSVTSVAMIAGRWGIGISTTFLGMQLLDQGLLAGTGLQPVQLLWMSHCCGTFFICVFMGVAILRTDWPAVVEEAVKFAKEEEAAAQALVVRSSTSFDVDNPVGRQHAKGGRLVSSKIPVGGRTNKKNKGNNENTKNKKDKKKNTTKKKDNKNKENKGNKENTKNTQDKASAEDKDNNKKKDKKT